MSAASNYLENLFLNTLLNQNATTISNIYMALYSTDPTDANTGSELTGNNYARVDVTSSFPAASGTAGSVSNNVAIVFNTVTGSSWTFGYWGILDASSSGNLLIHGAFSTSITVPVGVNFQINSGNLTVTLA